MGNTRSYQGLFIIHPDKEEAAEEVRGSIKSIISENSGTVVDEKTIGKKMLATPIKKQKEGIYYEVSFKAEPSAVEKIVRLCRINTDIMRTLIDKVKASVAEE